MSKRKEGSHKYQAAIWRGAMLQMLDDLDGLVELYKAKAEAHERRHEHNLASVWRLAARSLKRVAAGEPVTDVYDDVRRSAYAFETGNTTKKQGSN